MAAVVQAGEIVRENLESVEQVVEVLDVDDRLQAADGGADALAEDGGFPDPGIGDAERAELFLEVFEL